MRIEHSISLYVYQDVENPVWKDFVIYIKVKAEDFKEVLEYWSIIGVEKRKVFEELKEHYTDIEKSYKNLRIKMSE